MKNDLKKLKIEKEKLKIYTKTQAGYEKNQSCWKVCETKQNKHLSI